MKRRREQRYVWADAVRDQVRAGHLDQHAGHVAAVLALHYVNGSCIAWPSIPELAQVTGKSQRTVKTAVRELVEQGFLDVRRGWPAGTSGNVYQLVNRGGE